MRPTEAPVELDRADQFDPEARGRATGGLATAVRRWRAEVPVPWFSTRRPLGRYLHQSGSRSTRPFDSEARAREPGHPAGAHAPLLVTLIAFALTLAVTAYGVEAGRTSIAMVGLAVGAVVAAAMAASAWRSIRTGKRACDVLDRALGESERARDELGVANERLRRSLADLRALQLAVVQGFVLIDERTQGRLRELVEEFGDELAALVDEALDDPNEVA
jgi:hypothetical protein